jgi:hypothetical protein
MDLREYIERTELATTPSALSGEAFGIPTAEAEEDIGVFKAAVDAGSIVSFVEGLDAQDKNDVLFSTQFAQRAASAKADRFLEVGKWYREYLEWLETLGWLVPQINFKSHALDEGELKMDAIALEIIAAVATGGQAAILKATLDALRGLAGDSKQIKLFDFHSSVQLAVISRWARCKRPRMTRYRLPWAPFTTSRSTIAKAFSLSTGGERPSTSGSALL